MNRDLQLELFNHALDELYRDSDLVNQVLEVTLTESCSRIEVRRYKLPAE
jgi:hypothetical protein